MSRFTSAFAVAISLLALVGVGFVLTSGPDRPDSEVGRVEMELLHARLNALDKRLDKLASRSADSTQAAPSTALSEGTPDARSRSEEDPVENGSSGDGALLARLETLETRLRGLEEDPIERAYAFLRSSNADLRKRGIRQLQSLAKTDPEARAALREMLADPDAGVRAVALDKIAEIKDQEAAPIALSLLDDENADVRRKAVHTLARLDAKEAATDIAGFIADEDDKMRWLAVDAMGKLGHRAASGALLEALSDENMGIRGEALLSLGEIGATEALPQVRAFYEEVTAEEGPDRGDHRYRAAFAMKQLGDASAAHVEIGRLGQTVLSEQEDGRRRIGALHGLIWLGRDELAARQVLEQAAQDSNEWIRRTAQRALTDAREKRDG